MTFRAGLVGIVAALSAGLANAQTATVKVRIADGVLVGAQTDQARVFKGVPYAAAPVGALRWKPAAAAARWTGDRQALTFGAACPQPELPPERAADYGAAVAPFSEDCLTLNIWAPPEAKRAPVMMWVHGGGHSIGAGSVPQYDGEAFARDGVIFVSVNYRLGLLGGFAHPALTRQAGPNEPLGSFGITDQIAALRWIQRNIAAFGGDPGNVTLFGESGGGGDTWRLLTTPSAKGLFQKAILESAGGWSTNPVTLARSEAAGVKVARDLGLPEDATAEQLRAVPWQALLKAKTEVGFSPIVDDRLIKESRDRAMAAGHVHDVPVMVGWNDDEATLMAAYGLAPADVLKDMPPAVRAVYEAAGDGRTEMSLARAQFTDVEMGAPARWLAASMASGAPAYLYLFSYVGENARAQASGAGHGAEVPYVFDTLDRIRHAPLTAADREVAKRIHGCWVSFAKTGKPSCPGGPEWPAYSREDDRLMELGVTNQVRQGFRKAQFDAQEASASPGK